MKIEKLTENKIRAIINDEDLIQNHTDLHSIMTNSLENQGILLEILSKAKEELGFNTENCKLLIEAFSTSDNLFVFMITKYEEKELKNSSQNLVSPKKLSVKRKSTNLNNVDVVYSFSKFEEFCEFCACINNIKYFDINKFSKNISLYLYNNTYYLTVNNINLNYKFLKTFYSTISEFAKVVSSSNSFQSKLLEKGKVIIKKNAINVCIKYFCQEN